MKKKLLSQALALVMCLGLCVPAYAASVTIKAPSGDMTVMLSDVISEETGTVYGETCKIYTVPTGSTLSAVGDEENVTHWYFPAQQISENGYIYDGSVYQPVPHDGIKLEESFLKSKLVVDECSMLAVTIGADVEETFLIKFADNAAPAAPAGFTDVAASYPYKDAISRAVKEDIAAGYSSGTFRPGSTCTASHILTFLWRANGHPGDRDDERTAVAA
ncbi:S-layer homology domain-containing protein [Oscillospiraceae bacterium 38-13]